MKRHFGLYITNAILISLFSFLYFVFSMINAVQYFEWNYLYALEMLGILLFEIFLMIMCSLLAFFTIKNKNFFLTVGIIVIYLWGRTLVSFIEMFFFSSVLNIVATSIEFLLCTAILVLSIIGFAITKPIGKDKEAREEINKKSTSSKTVSLEDISKAKELLDQGALTNEEFYEIKRRAFDK